MKLSVFISLLFVISVPYFLNAQALTNNGDTLYIGNGAIMAINGSFQNLDNGTSYPYIRNNGTLQISGDFSKSANTIYAGQDSFLLSGSGSQNIAGLSFWYMSVTGGGTKTFTSDAFITKSMVVTNGTVNTSGHTITLDSSATLVEDSVNNITGSVTMQKYLVKGTNYTFGGMGIEIKADSMTPGLTTVMRVTGSHLNGNGYQSVNRYFTITPAHNGNTGSSVKFRYYDSELNSISESDLAIYRHKNSGKWEYDGYNSRNAGGNFLMASLDSLGVITAGSVLNPLPVEIISFDATLFNPETSKLDWTTASEINNDHFDVERSEDGKIFIQVGEVKGNGTTNSLMEYHYEDKFGVVNTPVLYYRLKQVDYNGAYMYSEIRKVEFSGQEKAFKAWYNSVIDKTEVLVHMEKQTQSSLRIINIQGKLIVEQSITLPEGSSHLELDMTGLAKGIYILSLENAEGKQLKRILKY